MLPNLFAYRLISGRAPRTRPPPNPATSPSPPPKSRLFCSPNPFPSPPHSTLRFKPSPTPTASPLPSSHRLSPLSASSTTSVSCPVPPLLRRNRRNSCAASSFQTSHSPRPVRSAASPPGSSSSRAFVRPCARPPSPSPAPLHLAKILPTRSTPSSSASLSAAANAALRLPATPAVAR